MDGSEARSGDHNDAEIDIISLAMGWACLGLTSGVLAEGRLNGALDISWVTVVLPVLLPLSMAMAYATVLTLRDLRAARA
ncbi:hypothetical protein [Lichenibacterium ramalinae]|uniref:Uncharacterized protein n=1 Tax=Lichenibacterium ramalinae TaxID=2316527 RepID=A0A4V1RI07_9HYPH|nr:hypothetical protein [Lichenibacterium ramalinae]RYB01887.1 hypothetical protein D3272_23585 [Lichenibacterium ramalinae]